MPAAWVSGGDGFAGRHLVELLERDGFAVLAPSRAELDLGDAEGVRRFAAAGGDLAAIFHLAAFSSPARSFDAPAEALLGNVAMTLNLLEAARHEAPEATVVLVSSGQVYGTPASLPVREDAPLAPQSPYAVSKVTSELLGRQYAERFGLAVIVVRPFNHAGPGQEEEYVVSSIARQVAAAEIAGEECVLETGNPDSARDFSDVRDVVAAYREAARLGSGTFNVCSGAAVAVRELVAMAAAAARVPVRHEVDAALVRPNETPVVYGSNQLLADATGWGPRIEIERTVADTLEWWRRRLAR